MKQKLVISLITGLILISAAAGYYLWQDTIFPQKGQPIYFHQDHRINLKAYPKKTSPGNKAQKAKHNPVVSNHEEAVKNHPLNISVCEDNPNAPDLLDKQLRRATTHDETPCAKVKLNMRF